MNPRRHSCRRTLCEVKAAEAKLQQVEARIAILRDAVETATAWLHRTLRDPALVRRVEEICFLKRRAESRLQNAEEAAIKLQGPR